MKPAEHDEDVAVSALLSGELVMGYVLHDFQYLDTHARWWEQCAWIHDLNATAAMWLTWAIEDAHIFDHVTLDYKAFVLVARSGSESYTFGASTFGYRPVYGCTKTYGLAALVPSLDVDDIRFKVPKIA